MGTQAHGLLPDHSPAALIVLDMISDFRFPDGPAIARAAVRIAPAIAHLKARASAAGIACLYVNDNPGRWRSDSQALIAHCRRAHSRGRTVVETLLPGARGYFILKPRHSAFYATPLGILLEHLGTKRLILTGISSHQCVLFTANDAHLRNFELIVPPDCIAGPNLSRPPFCASLLPSRPPSDRTTGISTRTPETQSQPLTPRALRSISD
jgi:nicotinamidase-related amidase